MFVFLRLPLHSSEAGSLVCLDSNHHSASKTLEEGDGEGVSIVKPLDDLLPKIASGDLDVRAQLQLLGEDRDKAIAADVDHLKLGARHVGDGHLVGRREETLVLRAVEHAQASESIR